MTPAGAAGLLVGVQTLTAGWAPSRTVPVRLGRPRAAQPAFPRPEHPPLELAVGFAAGTFTAVIGRSFGPRRLGRRRGDRVGLVPPTPGLLPWLTAAQNVALPLWRRGRRPERGAVAALLARVGLADRAGDRPGALSESERQRVAIARALAARPGVLIADEPAGGLDRRSGQEILGLLRGLVDEDGQTVVLVTEDPVAASFADRVVFVADGRVATTMADLSADAVERIRCELDRELAGIRR